MARAGRLPGLDEPFRERYETEPNLKRAVDTIYYMLAESLLTTEDVARAAVLAAQLYAERHNAPVMIRIEG